MVTYLKDLVFKIFIKWLKQVMVKGPIEANKLEIKFHLSIGYLAFHLGHLLSCVTFSKFLPLYEFPHGKMRIKGDGWMESLTRWTRVWVNSRRW